MVDIAGDVILRYIWYGDCMLSGVKNEGGKNMAKIHEWDHSLQQEYSQDLHTYLTAIKTLNRWTLFRQEYKELKSLSILIKAELERRGEKPSWT